MKNTYSPIAIFAYNRPLHLKACIESLCNNQEFSKSKVYIFIDGPRNQYDVEKQKEIIEVINSFKIIELQIFISKENIGLSSNLTQGISKVINIHKQVVVIEDDILVSRYFLKYMNDALNVFSSNKKVASIHGYIYPLSKDLQDNFFLRGADCWGWATWERAWNLFEPDGEKLLKQLIQTKLMTSFNLDGVGPFKKMLQDQIKGKNDSWAILWHASTFLKDMYTLYPRESLVTNIGLDGSGTHSGTNLGMKSKITEEPVPVINQKVIEDYQTRDEIKKFFIRQRRRNYLRFFGINLYE